MARFIVTILYCESPRDQRTLFPVFADNTKVFSPMKKTSQVPFSLQSYILTKCIQFFRGGGDFSHRACCQLPSVMFMLIR